MIDEKCPIHDEYDPECDDCNAFVDKFLEEHKDLMEDLAKLEELEKAELENIEKKNG